MVGKRYRFAIRGNFGMADPSDAVNQDFPDGVFQFPVVSLGHEADHCHIFSIGRPVRVLNIVEHLARAATVPVLAYPPSCTVFKRIASSPFFDIERTSACFSPMGREPGSSVLTK